MFPELSAEQWEKVRDMVAVANDVLSAEKAKLPTEREVKIVIPSLGGAKEQILHVLVYNRAFSPQDGA